MYTVYSQMNDQNWWKIMSENKIKGGHIVRVWVWREVQFLLVLEFFSPLFPAIFVNSYAAVPPSQVYPLTGPLFPLPFFLPVPVLSYVSFALFLAFSLSKAMLSIFPSFFCLFMCPFRHNLQPLSFNFKMQIRFSTENATMELKGEKIYILQKGRRKKKLFTGKDMACSLMQGQSTACVFQGCHA